MEGHTGEIFSTAISPCGGRIASASNDMTVRLWDVQTGEGLLVLESHGSSFGMVKYSPDGRQIVSGSLKGVIQLWDAETGEPGAVLNLSDRSLGALRSIACSPDGRWIATGHHWGHFQLWNAVTLEPGPILSGHNNSVTQLDYSSDGRWVASSSDHTVRLWDTSTDTLSTILTNEQGVFCIAFSPDSNQIASGGMDNKLRLWEVGSSWSRVGEQVDSAVEGLAYSFDGCTLFSHDENGIFRQWDAGVGTAIPISYKIPTHTEITCRGYAPDGSQLAFGYLDGSIRLWSCQTGKVGPIMEGSSTRIARLLYSPCCRWMVSIDSVDSGNMRLWALHDVELHHLADVDNNLRGVTIVTFSPTGDQLAFSAEGGIHLFDTKSREHLSRIELKDCITSLAYSPTGQQIASGTLSGRTYICDMQSKKPGAILKGCGELVEFVAYSPCGRRIVLACDKFVEIWNCRLSDAVESWSKVHTINAFFRLVSRLAWNPIIPMEFVTGCRDGSVRVWRISIDEDENTVSRMVWGSNLGMLYAEGAILTNALSLSPIFQKLLIQHGALLPPQ
jgi:WD40 repeat protein